MSIVINVPVEFTFNLEAFLSPAAAISVILLDDSGASNFYQDGTALGAVYTPPTEAVQGSYIFDYTFPSGGNWQVLLVEGGPDDYQMLHSRSLYVTEGDPAYVTTVSIDPADWRL